MIRSARPFLPRCMILLVNRVTNSLLYRASGTSGRRTILARRGMASFASKANRTSRSGVQTTSVSLAHEKAVNAHRLRRQAALSCFLSSASAGRRCQALLGLLGRLGSVLRPSLFPILYATSIQRATDDVVTNAGKVLDPPAAHQHHRVLLQVMPLTRNVRCHFHLVGQANSGDFPQRGIRLLGRHGLDLGAYATLLRRVAPPALTTGIPTHGCIGVSEGWRLGLLLDAFSAFTDQLINRWHDNTPYRTDG